jgi:hypothetical protein
MNIAEMHWDFKLKANKLDSNHKKDLSTQEIDHFLNLAQTYFFESIYAGNFARLQKFGFESIQQTIDILSNFIPKNGQSMPITNFGEGKYFVSFKDLNYKYAHLIRTHLNTSCGEISVSIEQHDDLNFLLKDEFKKPSTKWKRALGVIQSDDEYSSGLLIYTDPTTSVDSVILEYLRCPSKLFYGRQDALNYEGYDSLEFITTGVGYKKGDDPVSCEFPEKYHPTIVDIAVREAYRALEYTEKVALQQDIIQQIKN